MGEKGGLNLNAFATNNPILFWDFLGLSDRPEWPTNCSEITAEVLGKIVNRIKKDIGYAFQFNKWLQDPSKQIDKMKGTRYPERHRQELIQKWNEKRRNYHKQALDECYKAKSELLKLIESCCPGGMAEAIDLLKNTISKDCKGIRELKYYDSPQYGPVNENEKELNNDDHTFKYIMIGTFLIKVGYDIGSMILTGGLYCPDC